MNWFDQLDAGRDEILIHDPDGHLANGANPEACEPARRIHVWTLRGVFMVYDGLLCDCGRQGLKL